MPAAGVSFVLGGHLDLPSLGRALGHHERERIFAELDQGAAVLACGEEDFTGDFGRTTLPSPDGLAFADGPAGFLEVYRGQGGDKLATCQQQQAEHGQIEPKSKRAVSRVGSRLWPLVQRFSTRVSTGAVVFGFRVSGFFLAAVFGLGPRAESWNTLAQDAGYAWQCPRGRVSRMIPPQKNF